MKARAISAVVYFEHEGRQNLPHVINTVKRAFEKRDDIRNCKIVIFTAAGEGPALVYNKFKQFSPKIIAVTFPPGFSVRRKDEDGNNVEVSVGVSEQLRRFFDGVGVTVLSSRLPFEGFDGADTIKRQMKLMSDVLSLFGGGFSLCVQAVLQACDMGAVDIGEKVVAMSGDCAAVVTASNTAKFLSSDRGLSINEILCKPKNLSIVRKTVQKTSPTTGELFPAGKEIKLLPPT
jgi:hypothetical protein